MPSNRLTAVGVVAACVAVLLPAQPAGAARQPTKNERAALARTLDWPQRCVVARISTVARGWAVATSTGRGSCIPGGGYVVLRRPARTWQQQWSNSGTQELPCTQLKRIPPKVGKDLGICGQ